MDDAHPLPTPLMLMHMDLDMLIDTPVSPMVTDLLALQWKRLPDKDSRDVFGKRIGARLESVLAECVDWDLRPPTPPQVTFATAISRVLGIDLPGEALRFRGPMNNFLDKHSEAFKAASAGKK